MPACRSKIVDFSFLLHFFFFRRSGELRFFETLSANKEMTPSAVLLFSPFFFFCTPELLICSGFSFFFSGFS